MWSHVVGPHTLSINHRNTCSHTHADCHTLMFMTWTGPGPGQTGESVWFKTVISSAINKSIRDEKAAVWEEWQPFWTDLHLRIYDVCRHWVGIQVQFYTERKEVGMWRSEVRRRGSVCSTGNAAACWVIYAKNTCWFLLKHQNQDSTDQTEEHSTAGRSNIDSGYVSCYIIHLHCYTHLVSVCVCTKKCLLALTLLSSTAPGLVTLNFISNNWYSCKILHFIFKNTINQKWHLFL